MAAADRLSRPLNSMAVVHSVLAAPWFVLLARVALTTAYWWGGLAKLWDFPGALAEVRHFGLEPSGILAGATIVVEIGASILLIVGRAVWVAAATLALFTALATVVGHAFWAVPPEHRGTELNAFLEHIGLIGGFMLAAALHEHQVREHRGHVGDPEEL